MSGQRLYRTARLSNERAELPLQDGGAETVATQTPPSGVSRRSFVKYAAIGGLAAVGVASGLVYPRGWQAWVNYGKKDWETAPGVVDYNKVLQLGWGPASLGFRNDIRNAPPSQRILNVAQWYDYWPGRVLRDFGIYMERRWGVTGVQVNWTSNIYTSNEELFTWVTQTGRKFDAMFPTNYTVETMEKAGILVNMNKAWLPNYLNIFGLVPSPLPDPRDAAHATPWAPEIPSQRTYPAFDTDGDTVPDYNNSARVDFRDPVLNGYAYRGNTSTYPTQKPHPQDGAWGEQDGMVAVPYQWGTTGIGYRSDVFRKQDIEALGWEAFELSDYTNPDRIDPDSGQPMVFDLTKKKMMLDDMREVFTAAFKARGWKEQVAEGIDPPTGITRNPDPPYDGEFQWSANETETAKLASAAEWLQSFQGSSWGFNTPQQGPWLVSGERYFDQAWSGDIMYAVRPNLEIHPPVDYFVPRQGGARWIDNAVIHRECERLWLTHEFINYIQDPAVQAAISSWNLYATPNAWTFEVLHNDPAYSTGTRGITQYYWNPAEDTRTYADIARDPVDGVGPYTGPPILNRCEYQKDVGVRNTLTYFKYWRTVKF